MSAWLYWLCVFQVDPQVQKTLLDSLARLNLFEVNFSQQTYSDFLEDTIAEGQLLIKRPGHMRMEYLKGDRKLLIWDGTTAYEKDHLADTESHQEFSKFRDEPLVQILLYGTNLLDHFLIDRIQVADREVFRLRPRNAGDYEVMLELDSQNLPSLLEVVGSDGEGTRFHFSRYNLKPNVSKETFQIPAK